VAGVLLVLLCVGPAVFAHWLAPYPYDEQHLDLDLRGPSPEHPFGTDELGRDILSRVLFGMRVTFLLGLVVVSMSYVTGLVLGSASGYFGGLTDEILMRATEVVMAFPAIVLAMAIVVALGPSVEHAAFAMILVWWPPYARLVRGEVLAVRGEEFVEAAVAVGQRPERILRKHVLPNIVPRVSVFATLDVGSAIVAGAGLSFLGLGAVPPSPELGSMVSKGAELPMAWWIALFPGLAILVSVLGVNFVGDGLRDLADPKWMTR
jgi:peptide/nickel transport system permease protein